MPENIEREVVLTNEERLRHLADGRAALARPTLADQARGVIVRNAENLSSEDEEVLLRLLIAHTHGRAALVKVQAWADEQSIQIPVRCGTRSALELGK